MLKQHLTRSYLQTGKKRKVFFLNFVKKTVDEKKKLNESQIINMDKAPLCFDCPSNRTFKNIDEKISINTAGNEKTSFTCVLACSANGQK